MNRVDKQHVVIDPKKVGFFFSDLRKNVTLTQATTEMDLEAIELSKISQGQRTTKNVSSLI